jgi:hypothetical protein
MFKIKSVFLLSVIAFYKFLINFVIKSSRVFISVADPDSFDTDLDPISEKTGSGPDPALYKFFANFLQQQIQFICKKLSRFL